jgi:hypothetical protein
MVRKLRSKWRRISKQLTWQGDVSRQGLASAMWRARREHRRIYATGRTVLVRVELEW